MPRTGPRPHCWKVQGHENHDQYLAFLQMRAQANYRRESFQLTFDDFQKLWQGKWHLKGRTSGSYCLTRHDPNGTWNISNCECIPRVEHLQRQKLYKQEAKQRNGNRTLQTNS